MKKPTTEPADWNAFVEYYKREGEFRPRSYDYPKAPEWLWRFQYNRWKKNLPPAEPAKP